MSDGLELDGDGHLGTSNVPVKRGPIALKLKSSSAADSPSQNPGAAKRRKVKPKSDGYPCLAGDSDLVWEQKLVLIGEIVDQPNLHICEHCGLPILVYGRLKRCKHSFCLTCMLNCQGKCPRCGEANQEHERGELGSVHICSYGGSRHGHSGCRRSYLSQRDLQAHVRYRHQGGQEKVTAIQQQQQQQQQQQTGGSIRPTMFPPSLIPPPPPGQRLPSYPLGLPPDLTPRGAPPFFPPGVNPPFPPRMDAPTAMFPARAPIPPQPPVVPRPPPPSLPFHPATPAVTVPPPLIPTPSPGPKPFVAFEARTSYP